MGSLNIAATREVIVAYGQSSSAWAASTINTWLGVIVGIIFLVVAGNVMRDKQKDESDKVKAIALLGVGSVIVAGVVMMFVNNKFGGAAGRIGETVN
ncbi:MULTISPECIES: hypothetical protein [Mycobacteriaceae]|nr:MULTISPECIES: hypothetical protein [Mycobacteriaceae]OBF76121.1 hypothetical protein A5751_24615 [Mycolicibacterium fortuitum]TMS51076.1 hypothetical protein E0T84_21200 [Mycobacterium sp. DBP42]